QNDLEKSGGYLEETVSMQPDFYRAWYNLSLAYQRQKRPQDAARAMRKAQGGR
ncbi:MAG: tetratricopeptide repeat protein, partial [Coraliomargarita sp.]|nr:tetratricopeptide repeat protein [Coraliomargarita sp.]